MAHIDIPLMERRAKNYRAIGQPRHAHQLEHAIQLLKERADGTGSEQSSWVREQALEPRPTIAVNKSGRAERIIRRLKGDDGEEPAPV